MNWRHGRWLAVLAIGLLTGWPASPGWSDEKQEQPSASGTWKSSLKTQDGRTIEATYKLRQDGDKLTGTVTGRDGKEVAIENGKVKQGQVSFDVTRERDGQKFTVHFQGRVGADSIKGKLDYERDGQTRTLDWSAKRVKATR